MGQRGDGPAVAQGREPALWAPEVGGFRDLRQHFRLQEAEGRTAGEAGQGGEGVLPSL